MRLIRQVTSVCLDTHRKDASGFIDLTPESVLLLLYIYSLRLIVLRTSHSAYESIPHPQNS